MIKLKSTDAPAPSYGVGDVFIMGAMGFVVVSCRKGMRADTSKDVLAIVFWHQDIRAEYNLSWMEASFLLDCKRDSAIPDMSRVWNAIRRAYKNLCKVENSSHAYHIAKSAYESTELFSEEDKLLYSLESLQT